MIHELKTWPVYFQAVLEGVKTFEIRKADRPFAVGDTLLLREWKPTGGKYSGRQVRVRVTYQLGAGPFAVPGHVVMAIERILCPQCLPHEQSTCPLLRGPKS